MLGGLCYFLSKTSAGNTSVGWVVLLPVGNGLCYFLSKTSAGNTSVGWFVLLPE